MMRFKIFQSIYQRLFFRKIPATSLGLFRICISLVLLLNLFLLYPDLKTWFSESGALPAKNSIDTLPGIRINLFRILPQTDSVLYSLFYLYLFSAFFLLFGLFSRVANLLVFVLTVSFSHRNVFILNSGDTLLRCLLFFMLFSPSGRCFSLDRLIKVFRNKATPEDRFYEPWAQRLMQFQLSVMYLATVVWKLRGDMWVDGTAVLMTMQLDEFKRFPMPEFSKSLWYSKLATYYTLFIEFAMGSLVWFKEFRYPILFMGALLHLGLEYSLNVPIFQWVTLSSYLLFVEHEKFVQLRNYLVRHLPKAITVYFDGDCGFCTRTVRVLEQLDLLQQVKFVSFRSKEITKISDFPSERAEHEVLLKTKRGWIGGYDVFREIFKRLPLTFLLSPLLYLPPIPQIGKKIYRSVAKHRHWISSQLLPDEDVCKIE